ncbi:MAG: barstar family protein [Dysgonamonadaceae bacterium]|jgi:RNAse (barnase) inhibitor barstar|nr:barstar family protein [Dysgonamonadaceae bacterium]
MTKEEFYFINDSEKINNNNSCILILKDNVISKEELFNEYYVKLKFPPYFGFNWNALWDCLSYLENVIQKEVIIYHQTFPKLEEKDLEIYLEILLDSVIQWKKYEEHNFEVYFNLKDYDKVKRLIGYKGL